MEQNYPIYDREFLAIMHSLRNWSHLLKGTTIPVLVYTDHANLCYYQDPHKIGPRVARYLPEHEQYNILLEYKQAQQIELMSSHTEKTTTWATTH